MKENLKPYARLQVSVVKAAPMGVVEYDRMMGAQNPATKDIPGYLIVDDKGNKGWLDKQSFDLQFNLADVEDGRKYVVDLGNQIREALVPFKKSSMALVPYLVSNFLLPGHMTIQQLAEALRCEDEDLAGYIDGSKSIRKEQRERLEALVESLEGIPRAAKEQIVDAVKTSAGTSDLEDLQAQFGK